MRGRGSARFRAALAGAALALPLAAPALEPRFDHRDQYGLMLSGAYGWSQQTVQGGQSRSAFQWNLQLAFSLDVWDGNELVFGASWIPRSDSMPEGTQAALNARYRGYFGSEEFKTYFEVGLWSGIYPRFGIGPMAAIGAQYDFDETWGLFATLSFATAFGQFRGVGAGLGTGVQARWP